jgi:elongation factor Ts
MTSSEFIRDIAMHICASEPQFVTREEVPTEVIEKEKEIALGQATADPKNANKPANILEKMVQGRIDKFLTDVVLAAAAFCQGSGDHHQRSCHADDRQDWREGQYPPIHPLQAG